MLLEGMDFVGQLPLSHAVGVEGESGVENRPDFRVQKMSLRHQERPRRVPIQLSGKIETLKPFFLEDIGPFFRFHRHAVGSGKTGRDETDVVNLVKGDVHLSACAFYQSLRAQCLAEEVGRPPYLTVSVEPVVLGYGCDPNSIVVLQTPEMSTT